MRIPCHALSGEYAPNSARAEGSSIVDEQGRSAETMMCARSKGGVNRGVQGLKLVSDCDLCSSY